MHKWIIALCLLGIIQQASAQKKKISTAELDQIRGLYYQRNTIGPFSGIAQEKHPNGKKKLQIPIKEGKLDGVAKEWAQDGTKIYEAQYVNGVQQGKETQWYATGKKKVELSYQNGEPEGICTEWHKNGPKKI